MPWALSVGVADAGPALRRLMTRAGSAESRAPARDRRAGGGAGVGVFGADTEAEGERTGQTHSPGPAPSATPSTSAICPSHTRPPAPVLQSGSDGQGPVPGYARPGHAAKTH